MKHRTTTPPYNYHGNAFAAPSKPIAPSMRGTSYPTGSEHRTAMSELSRRWFRTDNPTVAPPPPPPKPELLQPRRDLSERKGMPTATSLPSQDLPTLSRAITELFSRLPLDKIGKEELLLAVLLILLGQAGADRETLLVLAVLLWWN